MSAVLSVQGPPRLPFAYLLRSPLGVSFDNKRVSHGTSNFLVAVIVPVSLLTGYPEGRYDGLVAPAEGCQSVSGQDRAGRLV